MNLWETIGIDGKLASGRFYRVLDVPLYQQREECLYMVERATPSKKWDAVVIGLSRHIRANIVNLIVLDEKKISLIWREMVDYHHAKIEPSYDHLLHYDRILSKYWGSLYRTYTIYR